MNIRIVLEITTGKPEPERPEQEIPGTTALITDLDGQEDAGELRARPMQPLRSFGFGRHR